MAPTGRPLRLLALTGTPPDVAPDEEPSEIFLTQGSERRGALAWSYDAIMAGAAGYVLKQIRGTDLVGAVRTVASGQSMLDPRAASQLMARLRDSSAKHDPLAGLSGQERRILELIGEGLTNRQIGERMFLAEKTVKNYVSALFAKLGMERRTQAAAYAARVFSDRDRPRE
jgi:two-component system, NarL family, response regulator DevR